MSGDRPTPEQIARWLWTDAAPRLLFLEELADHGYVVIHTDELRARDEAMVQAAHDVLGQRDQFTNDQYDAIIAAAEQADR